MSHGPTRVSAMQSPDEGFGEIITWVDHTSQVGHDNFPCLTPGLDRKVLDLNMAGSGSRLRVVDNIDVRHIVSEASTRASLEEPQFRKDAAKVAQHLRAGNTRVKLCFRRAGGRHGLKT